MAKKQQPESGLVSVNLIERHDLPGLKLRPGRIKVSPALRDELKAAGKLAE